MCQESGVIEVILLTWESEGDILVKISYFIQKL
jgi:hypothetical protein